MIYGYNRGGKTWMISTILDTLKEGEGVLYLDYRGGKATFYARYSQEFIDSHMRTANPTNLIEIVTVLGWARQKAEQGKLKWILVDTISDMQKAVMADIKRTKLKLKDDGYELITTSKAKSTYDEWGLNKDRMYGITSALVDMKDSCGINIAFTALCNDKESPKRPMIDTSVAEAINGMCDCILFLSRAEVISKGQSKMRHVCYTTQVDTMSDFVAGDRTNILPSMIPSNFAYIMKQLSKPQQTKNP